MASPNAAGVAALMASAGVQSSGSIVARLENTADEIACPPDLSTYDFFPAVDHGAHQVCQGGIGFDSFKSLRRGQCRSGPRRLDLTIRGGASVEDD
jgi:hypothetical protein